MTHGDYYLLTNGGYFGPGEEPPGLSEEPVPDSTASPEPSPARTPPHSVQVQRDPDVLPDLQNQSLHGWQLAA